MFKNIAIIGSSGAIGHACMLQLSKQTNMKQVHAFSRNPPHDTHPIITYHSINYDNESSIHEAATIASAQSPLDLVLVTTGILHDAAIMPEKSLRDLSAYNLQHLYTANTIVPALIAKYFIPKLSHKNRSVFAALSARVGSITDNHLGGWYGYRASKTALNMMIKCMALEVARQNSHAIIVGLHPGTVDSPLSQPFQSTIPQNQLITPEHSAKNLLLVIQSLSQNDSGGCFAWDGQKIPP